MLATEKEVIMLDLREAQIEGDEAVVSRLKHFYQDVRVGDIDVLFYGKDALTFRLVMPREDVCVLVPNQAVHRVWDKKEEGGFREAKIAKIDHDIFCGLLERPLAPRVLVCFHPVEDMSRIHKNTVEL